MKIEVLYALTAKQYQVVLELPTGATIAQAIEHLAQMPECSDWEINGSAVGVFGQARSLETSLVAGDRLEIYRSLLIDPKTARRRRAESQRAGT